MKCLLSILSGCLTLACAWANFTEITSRSLVMRNMRCGVRSAYVTTEMSNPANQVGNCVYTIRANSVRVCQLRIDFSSILAQPSQTAARPYPHCVNDAISIDGWEICGTNLDQHIYIPWDVQRLTDTKEITVRLGDRVADGTLGPFMWQMRVTQIDCREKGLLARYSELRAPEGCAQYFTGPTGTIESFNLNSQNGPYLGNMNYAICFRRQASHTQLSLTPQFFELSIEDDTEAGYDAFCMPQIETAGFRRDFLSIPYGRTLNAAGIEVTVTHFCGTSLIVGTPVVTGVPGPFMLLFTSDLITSVEEKGFRFTYALS